jgi:hypothetical protein
VPGKAFFFEKKKQKTFVSAVAEWMDKGFLVLFFKKGLLASPVLLHGDGRLRSTPTMCSRRPSRGLRRETTACARVARPQLRSV